MTYIGALLNFSRISNIWLGASDERKPNFFVWAENGKSPAYEIPWAQGFPLMGQTKETCISLLSAPISWMNIQCMEELSFACKWNSLRNSTFAPQKSSKVHFRRLKPWAQGVHTGRSEFYIINDKRDLSWNDTRRLCQKYGMDLSFIDSTAKFQHISSQMKWEIFQSDYTRYWLGAVRYSQARSQYEFKWLNGLHQDLRGRSWQIHEESWTRKCLYAFARHQADKNKPLFYMEDCEENSLFEVAVCEKMDKKFRCSSDLDCHKYASCISQRCLCMKGFAGNGFYCHDINECCGFGSYTLPHTYSLLGGCQGDARCPGCLNYVGSFTCEGCNFEHWDSQNVSGHFGIGEIKQKQSCHETNPCYSQFRMKDEHSHS